MMKTKEKILIVEDEDIMRDALTEWLSDSGYNVDSTPDGYEALKILEGKDVAIMLVDLKMPKIDGLSVLKMAKEKKPGVKVIMITAYPSIETAVEAGKAGAEDYISKPFTPEAIEKAINDLLVKDTAGQAEDKLMAEAVKAIPVKKEEYSIDEAKELFMKGNFALAKSAFETILRKEPANMEARLFLSRVHRAVEEGRSPVIAGKEAAAAPETERKECIWMKSGVVSYRLCYNDYDCTSCEFNQQIMEERKKAKTDTRFDEEMEALRRQPATQRKCRHMLSGKVAYRVCSKLYQCGICEFDQQVEDVGMK
ncbi:MAG: response regulator [Chloroflexi bacterium]|nr:response regulator [Chloroflexota bacterium]